MENWTVKIVDKGYCDVLDIFVYQRDFDGKIHLLQKGDLVETFDSGAVKEPSFKMNKFQLQAFADAMSDMGIKPQEGFLEGKLGATEKHLEDMRTLVFKTQPSL